MSIVVREVEPNVFEPIGGNPELDSLDGELRAPLLTILVDSWTPEDRARFGIYLVAPFTIPSGKQRVGQPVYSRVEGAVVEWFDVEDIPPPPDPMPNTLAELQALLVALTTRVGELENPTP